VNDPTNWNIDPSIKSIEVENPEMAKEMARRWNAYPGMVAVLRRIATPSLGGKLQQYQAQQALHELGEKQ
jgi:hypothetical protein